MVKKVVKEDSDWEKKLAKDAASERAREKSGTGGLGNKLSIKGRRFTFGGENLGRTLKCVVVEFVYLNTFYKGKFSEDKANIPSCFALSEDGEDIVPHDNVKSKQSDACDVCPQNQWASAAKGRGKACQGRRRLAIIHEDDLDDLENATVAFLELPVTSVKNWVKFTEECTTKLSRPFYAVKALLSFDDDEDWPKVEFEVAEKIKDKETIEGIQEMREKVREDLMTPYDSSSDDDDDEDEDAPKKSKKKRPVKDDDDDEDEKPKRKVKKKPAKDDDDEDEDEDDDSEDDDEEDDEDDEEDDKPTRKAKSAKLGKGKRGSKSSSDDDDDDDDEDDDSDEDEEDDEEERPARRGKVSKKGKAAKDDDDDDEDEAPKPKKRSRFGK